MVERHAARRAPKVSATDLRTTYLRQPTAFCPGCGHGIFMNAFLRAAARSGLDFQHTTFVSGIGCGAWVPSPHFAADSLHVTHGRALAFAAGVKLAVPDLRVIVISGDGDLTTIGGNHLIHAARRNLPITVFCLNNWLFGMTGGQVSATTPASYRTSTTPAGNPDRAFDLVTLTRGAGAPYVARWSVSQPHRLQQGIIRALQQPGFAFVEVLSTCPTHFGRANRDLWDDEQLPTAWAMLRWLDSRCIDRRGEMQTIRSEEDAEFGCPKGTAHDEAVDEITMSRIPIGEWVASEACPWAR